MADDQQKWFILRRSANWASGYYYECEDEEGNSRTLHEDTIKVLVALGVSFHTARHEGGNPNGSPGSRAAGAPVEVVLKTELDNNTPWNLGSLPVLEGSMIDRTVALHVRKQILESGKDVVVKFRG